MDKIFIKGLTLEAIIGIYPHERIKKQPVIIDLDLFVDIKESSRSGLINDTVDYDIVIKRISELVAQSQFELIESLLEHIADAILREFRVYKLCCTLYKPQAIHNAQMVGLTIERYKKQV